MQVRIARSAETDLLEGYAFYEEQQPGIGEYFLDSLFADIDALVLFAGIHPKPGWPAAPYAGQAFSIRHLLRSPGRHCHRCRRAGLSAESRFDHGAIEA